MAEREFKERWLDRLYVAMRRLTRLRELRAAGVDARDVLRADEAIAKEPAIIRKFHRAAAKAGDLPAQWPANVAEIAKELGLANAIEHGAAEASRQHALVKELEDRLKLLDIRGLEIAGGGDTVVINGRASSPDTIDRAGEIARDSKKWSVVQNQIVLAQT